MSEKKTAQFLFFAIVPALVFPVCGHLNVSDLARGLAESGLIAFQMIFVLKLLRHKITERNAR